MTREKKNYYKLFGTWSKQYIITHGVGKYQFLDVAIQVVYTNELVTKLKVVKKDIIKNSLLDT